MYAVIQTGGKQYRVQEGDVLRVARLSTEAGQKVNFDDVLLVGEGDGIKIGKDAAASSVTAEVVKHGLGKKVEIFKKRRRKNSQLTQGHRQAYTSVRIIGIGAAKVAPAKKVAARSDEAKAAAKKPEAAVKQSAEKTVSAKATAKTTAKPAPRKASASAAKKPAATSKE